MAASRIKTANKSQKEKREENQTFDPFHARPIFQKKKSTVHNKRNSVKLGKRPVEPEGTYLATKKKPNPKNSRNTWNETQMFFEFFENWFTFFLMILATPTAGCTRGEPAVSHAVVRSVAALKSPWRPAPFCFSVAQFLFSFFFYFFFFFFLFFLPVWPFFLFFRDYRVATVIWSAYVPSFT